MSGIDRGAVGTDEDRVVILNLLVGDVGPVSISALIAIEIISKMFQV